MGNIGYMDDKLKVYAEDFSMGLAAFVKMQRLVQSYMPFPCDGSDESTRAFIWALQTEIGELSNELAIKPWKVGNTMSDEMNDAALTEFADVMAFLACCMLNVSVRTGVDAESFADDLSVRYWTICHAAINRHSLHSMDG